VDEAVKIMMSLFDEEQIMKSFIKSERYEAAQDKAKENSRAGICRPSITRFK
jgi:hypothetical protein